MLVRTVHAVDYRFVIAFVVWFTTTAWVADDIATSLQSVAASFIRTATSSSLLGF